MPNSILINWFKGSKLRVNKIVRDEIQTDCPICGHENFYFNVNKMIGYCHRASCHYTATLNHLIEYVGYSPRETWNLKKEAVKVYEPVKLPNYTKNILDNLSKDSMADTAYEYILLFRKVPPHLIGQFNIEYDNNGTVYIPIYENNKLVQYLSRNIYHKEYRYGKGAPITNYFIGWDEAQYWDRLSIVENTFVSLALREQDKCVSAFGSNLSDTQINKIKAAHNIKSVAIMFDEGAEKSAEKAVNKLRYNGIPACRISIPGQPDWHDHKWIYFKFKRAHTLAREGISKL